MTSHNKVYTEEYKVTDEKIFWPISQTVLYTAVNISLYVYMTLEAQTFGIYQPLTTQTQRDYLWTIEVGMVERSWRKTSTFYSALLYVVLIFIMKVYPYIASV